MPAGSIQRFHDVASSKNNDDKIDFDEFKKAFLELKLQTDALNPDLKNPSQGFYNDYTKSQYDLFHKLRAMEGMKGVDFEAIKTSDAYREASRFAGNFSDPVIRDAFDKLAGEDGFIDLADAQKNLAAFQDAPVGQSGSLTQGHYEMVEETTFPEGTEATVDGLSVVVNGSVQKDPKITITSEKRYAYCAGEPSADYQARLSLEDATAWQRDPALPIPDDMKVVVSPDQPSNRARLSGSTYAFSTARGEADWDKSERVKTAALRDLVVGPDQQLSDADIRQNFDWNAELGAFVLKPEVAARTPAHPLAELSGSEARTYAKLAGDRNSAFGVDRQTFKEAVVSGKIKPDNLDHLPAGLKRDPFGVSFRHSKEENVRAELADLAFDAADKNHDNVLNPDEFANAADVRTLNRALGTNLMYFGTGLLAVPVIGVTNAVVGHRRKMNRVDVAFEHVMAQRALKGLNSMDSKNLSENDLNQIKEHYGVEDNNKNRYYPFAHKARSEGRGVSVRDVVGILPEGDKVRITSDVISESEYVDLYLSGFIKDKKRPYGTQAQTERAKEEYKKLERNPGTNDVSIFQLYGDLHRVRD